MKPKFYTTRFRRLNLGASLVTLITVCFGGAASAADWDGTGTVNTNWNDNGNWSGDNGTGGSDAVININSPIATISANIVAVPVDILVGTGGSTNGRLDHTAGTAQTGNGNWMAVGRDGGAGLYNLGNTGASGGTFTSLGQGSGSMNVGGRLYVGGQEGYGGGGGNGTVNVNTTGTLAVGNRLEVGINSSTGTLNIDSGAVTAGEWLRFGQGAGANGTLRISGGSLTKTGGEHLAIGNDGGTGSATISGGALSVNNETWIANGAGSTGTMTVSAGTIATNSWVAVGRSGGTQGTLNMNGGTWTKTGDGHLIVGDNATGVATISGTASFSSNNDVWVGQAGGGNGSLTISDSGSLTNNAWVAIGRDGGTGLVNMTGGTWTKNGDAKFIVGANGPGILTLNGGLVDVKGGWTWVGEAPGATTAVLTINTGEFRTPIMSVGPEAPNAILNLNGGTLRLTRFSGNREQDAFQNSGTGTIHFNGTQIIVTGDSGVFTNQVDNLDIATGGLRVNTNGFTSTTTQGFSGVGGVVKTGTGTLSLHGANSYAGTTTVSAGRLNLGGDSTGTGAITVANGAALGIRQTTPNDSFETTAATFGTASGATSLNVDLGNAAANPTAAAFRVTGTLTLNGPVTLNISDDLPAVGTYPLVSYTGAKAGTGSFVLGSLPYGVVATLNDNGTGLVTLNVTSASLLTWRGTTNADWNNSPSAINWFDQVTNSAAAYANPAGVRFDDSVTGSSDIQLDVTVAPSNVVFDSTFDYSLNGSGKITGTTGLRKAGGGLLNIFTVNDYTGVTRLEGGVVYADVLANGGVASTLGAATGAPGNLVFAGGTLIYTGGAVSIDRGFSIAANDNTVVSMLGILGDVTTTGQITATMGKFSKFGSGVLTLSGTGANVLGVGSDGDNVPAAFRVADGGMVFNGAGQTNTVTGRTFFGSESGTQAVTFANGASFTGNGRTSVAFATDTNTTLTVSGTSSLQLNDAFQIALTPTSTGTVIVQDSGSINKVGGWFSIGNDGTGVMTVRNSGSVTSNGDFNIGDVGAANGTLNLENSATVTSTGPVYIAKNGTTGTVNMSGGSLMTGPDTNVAGGNGSHGNLNISGTAIYTSNGRVQVGPGGGSIGSVIIEGSGKLQVNNYASVGYNGSGTVLVKNNGSLVVNDDFSVNEAGDVPAVVTVQDNATMSVGTTLFIGRNGGRVGTLNVSGTATMSQTGAASNFRVGDSGTGTLNISGTATVNVAANTGTVLTVNAGATGTVNLNGGALVTKKVSKGGGTGTFNFNGGVLRAATGSDTNFLSGVDAMVASGGAFIDSNGQTVAVGVVLGNGGGGLTKQGAGTLQLNAANAYTGTTSVAQGTLGGTGSVAGNLSVPTGSSVAPGAAGIGTFTVGGGTTIGGTYVCEVSGTTSDVLATGALTISPGATLDFNALAAPAGSPIVIATYTSLSGTFANVVDLPSGYTVNYAYEGNKIALVGGASNPYSDWLALYSLNPATDGLPGFDKDVDGQINLVEFALGGSPISGSNNAKVFSLVADSSADGDSTAELLLTIAVRSGTPAFSTGGTSSTASKDGVTYTVEGGTTLGSGTFTGTVVPVNVVAPPSPNNTAPTGYEFRTFSLSGSNGVANKGFLRVKINN